MNQLNLFSTRQLAYRDAKERRNALHQKILHSLTYDGIGTPDQVAERIEEDRLSIRPRFSELAKEGRIVKTGLRLRNESGKMANVWRLAI